MVIALLLVEATVNRGMASAAVEARTGSCTETSLQQRPSRLLLVETGANAPLLCGAIVLDYRGGGVVPTRLRKSIQQTIDSQSSWRYAPYPGGSGREACEPRQVEMKQRREIPGAAACPRESKKDGCKAVLF
jgi:hypothetical protein